jgi:peptidoglycan/LPS O-acetylase OafA/YrhL
MVRRKRKILLIAAGVLYIAFGILAFFDIPGGHDEHHHSTAHNLTHLILGALLLVVALRSPARVRQYLCLGLAAGYIVIGWIGLRTGHTATVALLPGLIEFHAGDYTVHLATAFVFLVLGVLRRSDEA